jgi:hypothetical protein
MKENRDNQSNFEERLLGELKGVVAQRAAEQEAATEAATAAPIRRRAPRLAFGAAAVCAAAVGVLAFNSGGDHASRAFAVEPQGDGGVTISVYSAEDAGGLEEALADAGIESQVDWLPAGMTCREPYFTPSSAKASWGGNIGGITLAGPGQAMTIGVMSPEQWNDTAANGSSGSLPNVALDPTQLGPDQTVVISGSRGAYGGKSEGGFEASLAIAEGPVQPCDPVKVPAGRTLEEMNKVIEAEAAGR